MDYQDPWVSDYYRMHPEAMPPGGRMKYGVVDWLHRRQEPRVLRQCAGITSVSADYPRQLSQRYEWLELEDWESGKLKMEANLGSRHLTPLLSPGDAARAGGNESGKQRPFVRHSLLSLVLPFPGDERDLQRVAADGTQQTSFSTSDGHRHWVYVGVCISQMLPALRAFFLALIEQLKLQPMLRENLRLHFIGTSYAAAGRGQKTVEPLAKEFGLDDLVVESTDRIPFSQTLRCLLDADALLVPGSDDPGYTASKLYPYILARKPLLVVFHEKSSVVRIVNQTKAGTVVTFRSGDDPAAIAEKITATGWLACPAIPATDWQAFEPYTARAMTHRLCDFFERVVGGQHGEQ